MAQLDYVTLVHACRGLSVCFIISITISNCILIFKTIRKGRFLYTPKSLIVISLAIGDIVLALFPLVILARLFFELSSGIELSCSTRKSIRSYLNFLIHFVYGMGIIVLAGEFVQRNRAPQRIGNATNNIVYSALPWVIGLIIILPLTMANTYNIYKDRYGIETCEFIGTQPRLNAMYFVSVILPAILAVTACAAVMCIKLSPVSYSSFPAAATYQVATHAVVTSSHHTNEGNAAGPPQYPGGQGPQFYNINTQGPQVYPISGPSHTPTASGNEKPGLDNNGQIFTTSIAPYPAQQYPAQQYPMQQYHTQQYHTPQYVVQYPPPQFPAQYPGQSNVVFLAPTNIVQQQNTTDPPNPVKEKKVLIIVAVIYFFCVVPFASLELLKGNKYGDEFSMDARDSYIIAQMCLFWLSVSRSLITPIIFIANN